MRCAGGEIESSPCAIERIGRRHCPSQCLSLAGKLIFGPPEEVGGEGRYE